MNPRKQILTNPSIFYILAVILFIAALIVHPWDHSYKNWVTQYRYLQPKGSQLYSFLQIIESLGKIGVTFFLIITIAGCGFKKLAYKMLIALVIMAVIVGALKPLVGRERPNHYNNRSFPSGDSATGSAFYSPLLGESISLTAAGVILIPAIGFLRTYDNWHWLSDVITGIGIGFLSTAIAIQLSRKKLKLLKIIKHRYFALTALLYILLCFIVGVYEGADNFLNFSEFYGPAIFVWIASCYVPFLFKIHSAQNKIPCKIILYLKTFTQHNFTTQKKESTKIKYFQIVAYIVLISFSIIPWFFQLQNLRFASTGVGVGLLLLLILAKKQLKHYNLRRAKSLIFYGTIILILCTVIILFQKYIIYEYSYSNLSSNNFLSKFRQIW